MLQFKLIWLVLLALAACSDPGGSPITTPANTWTWVPFAGARCADNSPTGIGVNINPKSTRVLIYLKGGGACWDHETCNGNPAMAVDLDGFDQTKFKALKLDQYTIFKRTAAANPFRDWSFVYVPYCTGDFHAGVQYSKVTGKHHLGHRNMAEYLKYLAPTFSGATQVLLAGSSAGGFGTVMNYHQVQAAFGSIPVDTVDDCGPMLGETYLKPKLQDAFISEWGLRQSVPPGCAACKTGYLHEVVRYLAASHPKRRFGLIAAQSDAVIRLYFGKGYTPSKLVMPDADFKAGLKHLADTVMAPYSNWQEFYIPSVLHVFLLRNPALVFSRGIKLSDWLQRLVDGSPTWTGVSPK